MVAGVLVTLNMLLSPHFILAVALHPLYWGMQATGGMVAGQLCAPDRAASRDVIRMLSQFVCCLFAVAYVFVYAGFVPFAEYAIHYGGQTITVKSVDVLFSVYYAMLVPVVFMRLPGDESGWHQLEVLLLRLDNFFVPIMILGVPLYGILLNVFLSDAHLGFGLAQAASFCTMWFVLSGISVGLEEAFFRCYGYFRDWRVVATADQYEIQGLTDTDTFSIDSGGMESGTV
eukprot:714381-Rhodomonas_salina.1